MASANPLWDLIQAYMDLPTHRYAPKPADLARETGVSDQVISKWKSTPTLPSAEQLSKFSIGTGIEYVSLLTAALKGKGYLPPDVEVEMILQMRAGEMSDWLEQRTGARWAQWPDGSVRGIRENRGAEVVQIAARDVGKPPGGRRREAEQADDDFEPR